MRAAVRVAVVGGMDAELALALREMGYRVDLLDETSPVSLLRTLARTRPALVHASDHHLTAVLIGRALGASVVLDVSAKQAGLQAARAARFAARTFCAGAAVRDALLQHGAPGARLQTSRALLALQPATPTPSADRGAPWVVCPAPASGADRGLSDLLLAFLSIARSRPLVNLLFAGAAGPDTQRLLAQADAAGMRRRVIARPSPIAELSRALSGAAAVVAPSRSPDLPDAVPEAMAAGAPVIATAVGPHPTWIREGKTGFLVPVRAPVALAARLAQVLDDRALALRVGEAGRRSMAELGSQRLRAQELSRAFVSLARPPHHAVQLTLQGQRA